MGRGADDLTTRTPEQRPRINQAPGIGRPAGHYTAHFDLESWPEERVGGKANGLYRARRAGLMIPNGFVVTTDAFFKAVRRVSVEVATVTELQDALRSVKLPQDLVDEVRINLEVIGTSSFAVRSSAVAEDGERSFAGQQYTVLGARNLSEVLQAIREVWASLYDPASLVYRSRLTVDEVPTGMAVVVEEMIDPDLAGVLFTRDPVEPDSGRAVVSAAPGLGTTVVGGEECDTYYVERPSGYQVKSSLMGEAPLMDEVRVAEFARISERIENIFESPMDIEWAQTSGDSGSQFYVLQARPITTAAAIEPEMSVWTNANVGEALPGVATPLTWSILKAFSRRGFEQAFGSLGLDVPEEFELVGSFFGRVYLNLTQFVTIASAIPVMSPGKLFSMAGGGGVELLEEVAVDEKSSRAFLSRLPQTVPRILAAQFSMPWVVPSWEAYFREECELFFERDLSAIKPADMAGELDELDGLFDWTGLITLTVSSNFLMSYVVTTEFLRGFGTRETIGSERELFRALDVLSAEPGRAMLEMGRIARRSRRLRRIITENPSDEIFEKLKEVSHYSDVAHLLDELDAFRREFGHRAPREAELATPRWREDLSFVFDVIRGFIDTRHLPSPKEVERDRQQALDDINAIVSRAFGPLLRPVFRGLLAFTRSNARRRESMRARVVDTLDMYRHFFLECGRRMVHRGVLREREDVFYLTIQEIRAFLEGGESYASYRLRVMVRKSIQEVFEDQPEPPPTFVLRGSQIIDEKNLEDDAEDSAPTDEIYGLAASGGRATGRARVIKNPADGDVVRPGEILIVPYADVGWTPLFIAASAVVMDLGGPLSHASIVAREFQVPAVVNASGATDRIKTGDLITVDGDRGVVFIRQSS